jgi:hypothetical protein
MPFAHERWFDPTDPAPDWGFVTEATTVWLLVAALVITVGVRLVARAWPGLDVLFIERLVPWMPFAVRIHLAVSLIGLLSLGYFLSPAMDLETDVWGFLLGAVMVGVAVCMAAGWCAREAALVLIASGLVAWIPFDFVAVLSRADVLALALFILVAGPGRWSADVETARTGPTSPSEHARAVWYLKAAAGVALIAVAFDEKLAVPQLAVDFLAEHPDFNIARSILGIDMSDLEFARVAGAIEVLFGLLVISGALPQVIVLVAGIPFNATLWFFGVHELLGHLPVYVTMLVLLVYGSSPQLRPAVASLRPGYWSTRAAA